MYLPCVTYTIARYHTLFFLFVAVHAVTRYPPFSFSCAVYLLFSCRHPSPCTFPYHFSLFMHYMPSFLFFSFATHVLARSFALFSLMCRTYFSFSFFRYPRPGMFPARFFRFVRCAYFSLSLCCSKQPPPFSLCKTPLHFLPLSTHAIARSSTPFLF